MTLLSRKADYALLILSFLHARRGCGNAREIAERYNLSRPFVANILKELCHRGYVSSHRGVKGGYALLPAAGGVTLADLLASIDEGFRLTICTTPAGGDDPCLLEAVCPVKTPLTEIHRRILDVLRGVTLAELFGEPSKVTELLPMLPATAAACCGAGHACHPEPTTA